VVVVEDAKTKDRSSSITETGATNNPHMAQPRVNRRKLQAPAPLEQKTLTQLMVVTKPMWLCGTRPWPHNNRLGSHKVTQRSLPEPPNHRHDIVLLDSH
jgi:hypothetical protein